MGAFVSAAIAAVLVLVDRFWLVIPIAAVGLAIDAFIRARQRSRLGRKRGFRISAGALLSAVVGAVVALIGFEFALAFSLLPVAIAHYRRVKRDPKAVGRNVKLGWIAVLDFAIPAIIAFTVGWVALNTRFQADLDALRSNIDAFPSFTFPDPADGPDRRSLDEHHPADHRRGLRLRPDPRPRPRGRVLPRDARPRARQALGRHARDGVSGGAADTRGYGPKRLRPAGGPSEQRTDRLPGRRRRRRPHRARGQGRDLHGRELDSGCCHQAIFADPDGNPLILHHRYAPAPGQ